MNKIFNVCKVEVNQNEKIQTYIDILDTNTKMPVTIINGKNEGKTVLITAGVHGCEYPCIKTAIELAKEIKPQDVSGQLIIIHPANTQGFFNRRAAIVPEDNKNLNRVFPGDKNGTISEKIAYVLTNEFQKIADFYFDIHGGDIHEDLHPYVYYPGIGDEEVIRKSREIAECINVSYMVKSSATTGAYNSAAINGTPSILIERGGCGVCKDEDVKKYKEDMYNALAVLGVLDNKNCISKNEDIIEIENVKYIDSTQDGCLEMFVKPGDKIKKGEKLCIVTDLFGNIINTYYAEFDCVILYNTVSFAIKKDESIIAYGEINL